jgi:ABC-type protease/lipase transport system fused ATPase/permease subunit
MPYSTASDGCGKTSLVVGDFDRDIQSVGRVVSPADVMIFPAASAHPDVAAALRDCRRASWSVALFSGLVNLLMLAGPLYMLQVYDRVLSSHSVPTLVALTVFLVGAYAIQGGLDLIRLRVVVRAATRSG